MSNQMTGRRRPRGDHERTRRKLAQVPQFQYIPPARALIQAVVIKITISGDESHRHLFRSLLS